jgi:hypothetical protein
MYTLDATNIGNHSRLHSRKLVRIQVFVSHQLLDSRRNVNAVTVLAAGAGTRTATPSLVASCRWLVVWGQDYVTMTGGKPQ